MKDIESVIEWCDTWKMNLNKDKCKIVKIHTDHDIIPTSIAGLNLIESSCERDLGVLVSRDLKWREQSIAASNKANQMLGLIKRSFKSRDAKTIKKLYCGLVRPLLEYAMPVWNSMSAQDTRTLEKVQRRATKLPRICHALPYDDRLEALGLQSLIQRRTRGDLIQLFKCIKGLDAVSWTRPLRRAPSASCLGPAGSVRGHEFKLEVENCKTYIRKHFFTNRATPIWNKLPQCCVAAKSVNSFKAHIDCHFFKQSAVKTTLL
jgi:ribonucleases P/MRP protein subunit RPP40